MMLMPVGWQVAAGRCGRPAALLLRKSSSAFHVNLESVVLVYDAGSSIGSRLASTSSGVRGAAMKEEQWIPCDFGKCDVAL